MKKLSVLSLAAVLLCAGLFLANKTINAQKAGAPKIEGWFLAGDNPSGYHTELDKTVYKTGAGSALLQSRADNTKENGFGTLMQTCSAKDYVGKRVKLTAYVKSKDVSGWAGVWLRIDGEQRDKTLGFDNMSDRPIKGTNDWTKCEIVLDVPTNSSTLNFGILLCGMGRVWLDGISFEIVGDSVKQTMPTSAIRQHPTNLNFDM